MRYYAIGSTLTLNIFEDYKESFKLFKAIKSDKEVSLSVKEKVYESLIEDVREYLRKEFSSKECYIKLLNIVDNYMHVIDIVEYDKDYVKITFFNKKKNIKGCVPVKWDEETKRPYIEIGE